MVATGTRYRHLVELAAGLLDSDKQPRDSAAITAHVMGAQFGRQPAFVVQVEALLAADERFSRDDTNLWRLADWAPAAGSLADTTLVVVDVETTGGRGEKHRVIEVAAVLVKHGKIVTHYESVVQPPQPLARASSEFTGITAAMLSDAPDGSVVLAQLREFVNGAVLVGHNVAADLALLNYEALWYGMPPFGNPALDTEELAARLLSDLKRPSLSRVAGALGIAQPLRHRALADARLTAAVLLAFLPRLADQGIATWDQLQEWLSSRLSSRQERVRRVRSVLPSGALGDLPDAPGVYMFHDASDAVLYVGKAASLRARVAQHFSGASLVARHHETLLDRTVRVSHELVPTELDALLLESARIRALSPPYNVLERSRKGCPFLRLELGPFPRLSAATVLAGDGDEYFGPYRTTQDVSRLLGTLRRVFQVRSCRRVLPATRKAMRVPCSRLPKGLCPAPCAAAVSVDEYHVVVDLARTYIQHGKQAAIVEAESRLTLLPPAGGGWEGGNPSWLRNYLLETISRVRRLRREITPVDGGRAGGAVLMIYPAATSGLRLFLLKDGQLLERLSLSTKADTHYAARHILGLLNHDHGRVEHAVVARELVPRPAAATDGPQGPALQPRQEPSILDSDQENIILRWLHRHLGSAEVLSLASEQSPEDLAALLADHLRCAQTFEYPDVEPEIVDGGEPLGSDVFDLEEVP